jgi:rubrerythrin
MRQCALCHTQTEDHVTMCPKCGADLNIDSVHAHTLRSILESPRASRVYIAAPEEACPVCRAVQGTYEKDAVPSLPVEGCSCPNGCMLRYEPFMFEVGP